MAKFFGQASDLSRLQKPRLSGLSVPHCTVKAVKVKGRTAAAWVDHRDRPGAGVASVDEGRVRQLAGVDEVGGPVGMRQGANGVGFPQS